MEKTLLLRIDSKGKDFDLPVDIYQAQDPAKYFWDRRQK